VIEHRILNPGRAHYCLCGREILAAPRMIRCRSCLEAMMARRELELAELADRREPAPGRAGSAR